MKTLLYILLFLSCISVSAQKKNLKKIFWEEERILTWKDFKAKADNSNKNIAAMTYSGIQYKNCRKEGGGKYTYQVASFFVPSLSWGRVKNDSVLAHEQIHFDIAELYARKLKKAFSDTNTPPQKSQSEIYKPLFKEYSETQKLFDKETHHGTLGRTNLQWQNKIRKELEELAAYKEDICY